jgi:hypothetical protein
MTFTEVGAPPFAPAPDAKQAMLAQSNAMRAQVQNMMTEVDARSRAASLAAGAKRLV